MISSAFDEAVPVVKEHTGVPCHVGNYSAVKHLSCAAERV